MRNLVRGTAIAVSLAAAFPIHAAEEDAVVVTATRYAQTDPNIPASISVITREDIRRTPAVTLLDVLKSQTGIELRPLYGPLGIDAALDVRGFGETSGSNTLILLDGQRLNPVDSGSINWSVIPLESVQRVEVIRGSGTVLFGDRASGGVVNIITDKSGAPRAWASASLGDYGYRGADAFKAGSKDDFYYSLSGHYGATHGYRQNSQQDEQSVGGRAGLRTSSGETFLDYSAYANSTGLPGALTRAQFDNNPRLSTSLNTFQNLSGYRLRPGIVSDLTQNLTLQAEAGFDQESSQFRMPGFALDRDRTIVSLTPRLRWLHRLGSLPSETVTGMDLYRGDVSGKSFSGFGDNRQTAAQTSTAFYAQNITDLTQTLHATVGLRHQQMKQKATDQSVALQAETVRSLNAYDVGLSYDLSRGARVYGKVGRTFRFANTDELFGFDPVTFATIFRGDLLPQYGPIREIGTKWRNGSVQAQASLYQLDLKNEINFNSTTGNNENFPGTRRRGLELEGRWAISPALQAKLGYARTDAKFTEGAFTGNTVPLVPDYKATAALSWNTGRTGTYGAALNQIGSRFFSTDLANAREKLPGYVTTDLQAAWNLRPWTLSARLLNAFNEKYAPFGTISFAGALSYFPADGRTLLMTAQYNFD